LQSAVQEPNWVDLNRWRGRYAPAKVDAWLRDPGSLTRALTSTCQGCFQVDVQQQGWHKALNSECQLLGTQQGLTALVREVKLLCDDVPWVFARTLIPAVHLRGRARRLAYLRNKPLGAVLFADPTTRRLAIEVACLNESHALFQQACSHLAEKPQEIWGRRTLFLYAGQKLLVNEIFLPIIPEKAS
jgi:chorismate--pyruvate lyase